jgi:hypothetical protein
VDIEDSYRRINNTILNVFCMTGTGNLSFIRQSCGHSEMCYLFSAVFDGMLGVSQSIVESMGSGK